MDENNTNETSNNSSASNGSKLMIIGLIAAFQIIEGGGVAYTMRSELGLVDKHASK